MTYLRMLLAGAVYTVVFVVGGVAIFAICSGLTMLVAIDWLAEKLDL